MINVPSLSTSSTGGLIFITSSRAKRTAEHRVRGGQLLAQSVSCAPYSCHPFYWPFRVRKILHHYFILGPSECADVIYGQLFSLPSVPPPLVRLLSLFTFAVTGSCVSVSRRSLSLCRRCEVELYRGAAAHVTKKHNSPRVMFFVPRLRTGERSRGSLSPA